MCERHDKFIAQNKELQLSAPVFACPDFDERPGKEDLLLMGWKNELSRSTPEELMFVSNAILDHLTGRTK